MKSSLFTNWGLAWLLAALLLTTGAFLNILQRVTHKMPPTDGVLWVQKPDGIFAEKVLQGYAGQRAGIFVGDRLLGVSLDGEKFEEIRNASDIQLFLEVAGQGGRLSYLVERTSYSFADRNYVVDLKNLDSLPRWKPSTFFLILVGFFWLATAVFVFFKQGSSSPFVLHFVAFCLMAFVFHVYNPIGTGEDLDLGLSLIDDIAFALFPPIFVHFCLRYPVHKEVFKSRYWKLLYLPALLLVLLDLSFSLSLLLPFTDSFKERLVEVINKYEVFRLINSLLLYHFVAGITLGAISLLWRFVRTKQPLVKQRLKWILWGTVSAAIPILSLQVVKSITELQEDFITSAISTLPLVFIPLSFGHSVVRYRLMDVDIVFRRALVYAITTLMIAMMIGAVALGLIFLTLGENLSTAEISLRVFVAVVAMAAIVLLSEPLKNFLQEKVDRFFYGERYDLRRGLLDFGKTLSVTTKLEPLLNALIDRLQQVLEVEKIAVFIEDENSPSGYYLAKSINLSKEYIIPTDFRQIIRIKSAKRGVVRADELEQENVTLRQELHYYVPCVVRGKMIAIIGLGRTKEGALLSSEDLEILRTISGYIAVAIENSLLYQEQEQRAKELAVLKEFNESIVESVSVGILTVNEESIATHCNSAFEEMFSVPRNQVVGKKIEEIFDESFLMSILSLLSDSGWHLQKTLRGYKLNAKTNNGKNLVLNVGIAPLRSISGSQTGSILVLEDVTFRVKLEEQLQQSEKLSSIGLLAAGVAHEVNTPLTGISSYTQMLLQMTPQEDPKRKILEKIQKQVERAANIVSNLLNFARTGNGKSELSKVDINRILEDTLQLLEPQLRKSQIEVVKDYARESIEINGSAGKLQQVFTNLILNAIDAMSLGGQITLKTYRESEKVIVEISDTGVGIEEKNLSKIYDPFFTTKPVGSGTGLGLAVAYGIVQEHAGKIEVSSQVGKGTTFRLEFPAVRVETTEEITV
ncbi:MAG: ATP-binding protein [Pyrinomonadaceae bacterium]|nr:ATP-binding protein [Pyrinomonadaceae bacterium]MCX7639014.1 ATP-binding protein [Pyrinomonadaceae bacterium]MDW8303766.1 ATP-binding protein [Acidobacteriota bacterium]